MRRIIYSVSLIALLPLKMMAQETISLSLEEAMDYAVKHNVNAKNARLDILVQKALNAEVTGIALPNINGKGEFDDYINPVKSFIPGEFFGGPAGSFTPVQFTPKYSSSASLSGSQVLFDGSVMVALQARNALIKLYEQKSKLSEEEVRYNVQKAYYSFVIAKRQYGILNNSLAYAREMARDQKAYFENGFAEKIDVDRTDVQINNLATDSIRIGGLISLSEQLLKFQMGMSNEQNIILTDTSFASNVKEANEMLLDEVAYENRSEFNLLQTQLMLNQYDLKRHKLSGIPSLAAFGTAAYSYQTNTFSDVFKEQYIFYSLVGLQLKVPIFDGLQRHNRVKQAKLSVEKTRNSIDNLKLTIDFQSAQSRTTLKNALLAMQSQERNMNLANSVLDLARKKYKAGVGSNTEVTLAQTEFLQAQNNYFQSMLDVVNAKSDLQKALGQFK